MIKIENISKIYVNDKQRFYAVKNVSLTINDGDIFGVIGFSGAGKSTLIRCINLLERPDSGAVFMDDINLTSLKEKQLRSIRTKIGMIFQHFNLFNSRTVLENVMFPLCYRGIKKEYVKNKAHELLELVDLKEKANAYPSTLSGGQKQRTAIARALANNPKILLCDEATSALDASSTQSVLSLLKKLNKQLNITVILITHEMRVIKEICNRVAFMENGEIIECGDVYDVFSDPRNSVTRDFLNTAGNLPYFDKSESQNKIAQIDNGQCLLQLSYIKNSAKKALVSYLSKTYNVDINIIYGNIEKIGEDILGNLTVTVSGKSVDIDSAIKCLLSNSVKVEVIKDGRVN